MYLSIPTITYSTFALHITRCVCVQGVSCLFIEFYSLSCCSYMNPLQCSSNLAISKNQLVCVYTLTYIIHNAYDSRQKFSIPKTTKLQLGILLSFSAPILFSVFSKCHEFDSDDSRLVFVWSYIKTDLD